MIILKYANLRDPSFLRAFYKLTNHTGFSTKTCIVIAKLKKRIDEEANIAQKEFVELLKQYAELDANGDFVPADNKPGTFKILEGKQADWDKASDTLLEKEFVIQKSKLQFEDVSDAKLSPQEFIHLEAIFEEISDEDVFNCVNTSVSASV
jgi:hypothetical protein